MIKFNVSTKDLLRVINAVSRVILRKNTLPILGDVLFSQQGDTFTLTGSSPENTLTMPIGITLNSGDTFQPFCLRTEGITSLLSTLPEQPLSMEVDTDRLSLRICYQGGEVTVPIESAVDYPKVAVLEKPIAEFSVPANIFLPAVAAASLHTVDDPLRPVFSAVCLDVNREGVTFVGTNGQSLYRFIYTHGAPFLSPAETERNEILLPATVVKAIATPFAASENITVIHDGKHMCLRDGDITFTIRDIEGTYPNYSSVIPRDVPYHVTLPLRAFSEALRRVQIMSNEASQLVRLFKDDLFLTLSSSDTDFSRSAQEQLTLAEVDTPCTLPSGFAIGFKASTMLTILGAITTENVRLELTAPSTAILVKEDAPNSALTELQMPMKLD